MGCGCGEENKPDCVHGGHGEGGNGSAGCGNGSAGCGIDGAGGDGGTKEQDSGTIWLQIFAVAMVILFIASMVVR